MRFAYFDSSALVKVYAWEGEGSKEVRRMVGQAVLARPTIRIVVCDIALSEAESAVARKERDREITTAQAERYLELIRTDFLLREPRPYQIVSASSVVQDAGGLSRLYGLKSMDAIQLAAALAVRSALPPGSDFVFVCADGKLCNAAAAENFPLHTLPRVEVRR